MKNNILSYLQSIENPEYEAEITVSDLNQKEKGLIGYSFSILNRAVLRVKTNMKNCYRVEFYNYQDFNKDIKPMINSKYPLVEKTTNNLRLITIDVDKDEGILMTLLHDLEDVLKEKMFDIYLNYSTVFEFGCCQRYEQCSDAKECLIKDTDPIFARGCQYRKNLESGRIFYGKNRII